MLCVFFCWVYGVIASSFPLSLALPLFLRAFVLLECRHVVSCMFAHWYISRISGQSR